MIIKINTKEKMLLQNETIEIEQKNYSENEIFEIVEKIRDAEIFYSQNDGEEDQKKAMILTQIADRIEKDFDEIMQ